MGNIVSGFRMTAIEPFNSDIFTEDDFLSSYVTDRPWPEPEPTINVLAVHDAGVEQPHTVSANNIPVDQHPVTSTSTMTQASTDDSIGARQSRKRRRPARFLPEIETPKLLNKIRQIDQVPVTSAPAQLSTPNIKQHLSDDLQPVQSKIKTPEEIRPFPKASPRKNTRKGRKRGETQILTDTPVRVKIEQDFKAKQMKKPKEKQQNKRTARRKLWFFKLFRNQNPFKFLTIFE